jgi:DNA-binding CsgD family transcriptional regulator
MIDISHPFFIIHEPFLKLNKLLRKHTSFGYFDYEQYYFDGHTVGLHQISEYSHQIVQAGLMPNLEELHHNRCHYLCLSCAAPLSELLIQQEMFAKNIAIAKQFEIFHRLCLLFRRTTYVEVFVFGLTKNHKNFFDIFVNEAGFLERFCIFFREAIHDTINDVAQNKILFDPTDSQMLFKDIELKNDNAYRNFLDDVHLKKYRITTKSGAVILSKREFECLLWFAKGKTAKQTARILSLSPRSVEAYINNLKNKLGCQSKFEFDEIAANNAIIKAYL